MTSAYQKPRIAFYAPLKHPDHPEPSGDRTFARLFLAALERAGYDPFVASTFMSYQKRPSAERFETQRTKGGSERGRLISAWEALDAAERPALWFTYHPYCKAPDWLGPEIAAHFGIPYVTAEACRTGQNTDADWASGRRVVADAIRQAAVNLCMKVTDRDYLETILTDTASIVPIPPFMDVDAFGPGVDWPAGFTNGYPTIITIGMMRPGKKAACHLALAESLGAIIDTPWNLIVVGDGPARPEIEAAFSFVPEDRIRFTGTLTPDQIAGTLKRADLFAWAGIAEPIGLVYLEAQLAGLPVAAQRSMGVPLVVRNGQTGLLTPEGDANAYGKAIRRLLEDEPLRTGMEQNAARFVREERSMASVVPLIKQALEPLLSQQGRG